MNQDLWSYIDSVKMKCVVDMEWNTLHFKNFVNITVDRDILTPHKKQNEIEEYRQRNHQEDIQIPLNKK